MNSARFNRSPHNSFRKPLDFLSSLSRSAASTSTPTDTHGKKSDGHTQRRHNRAGSLDDTDADDVEYYAQMEGRRSHSTQNSQSELQPPIPLIDIGSRTTSPYPRIRSAAQSEDEDDDFEPASSIRPLVGRGSGRAKRNLMSQGGLGYFLYNTWAGWQVWVGLLVFLVGGCSFGLLLMNRFIMSTGVYKFPFPLAHTYMQLVITHLLLIFVSTLTRILDFPFRWLGLGGVVAPAFPVNQGAVYRGGSQNQVLRSAARWLSHGSGGIAGGGLFEFDKQIAKQVLPLAIVYVLRVLLSNFSFAYVHHVPYYDSN